MKTIIFFLTILFLVATLNITTSNAQDAPQLSLPADAIARLDAGHTVFSVEFSPDGSLLASGGNSEDGTGPISDRDLVVRLWDVATATLRNTLTGHTGGIKSISFSPDGTTLASGGGPYPNGKVRLWDVATGTLKNTLTGHTHEIFSVAFSPDGTTLASGSRDRTVRLWDMATGTLKNTLRGLGAESVAFSPDGSILANGSYRERQSDRIVELWDVATGTLKNTLTLYVSTVNSVAFSPDGTTLASGGWDDVPDDGNDGGNEAKVRLWDVATGTLRNTFTPAHLYAIESVAFSPDGTTLASGGRDGIVRLWDVATGALIKTLKTFTEDPVPVNSVAFSPDGSLLASGSWDGTVILWGITATGGPITFPPAAIADPTFPTNTPITPVFLPEATGGTPPYSYTLSPIPDGLAFDTTTRELNGTPTTPGTTEVTYTATDATGASASLTFTITVTDAPTANITFAPSVIDDLALSVNTPMEPVYLPLAEGGTSPYMYTLDPIPAGLAFDAAIQLLSGTPTTVGTTMLTYTATDTTGASASLTFTITVTEDGGLNLDVNGDGQITVVDLAIVALFYGTHVPVGVSLPADVNADGIVDLSDLTVVAQGIDAAGGGLNQLSLQEVELAVLIAAEQAAALEAAAGAPMRAGITGQMLSVPLSPKNVADALLAAQSDARLQKHFAALEGLLTLLTEMNAVPETTALLPNYPNPFNPETWFPYHLSTDAEVIVRIYDMRGVSVRELVLGHQPAGVYQSRGRAAYWDGKNNHGEPVASGVYFYTLTAGEFSATRKLMIRK